MLLVVAVLEAVHLCDRISFDTSRLGIFVVGFAVFPLQAPGGGRGLAGYYRIGKIPNDKYTQQVNWNWAQRVEYSSVVAVQ